VHPRTPSPTKHPGSDEWLYYRLPGVPPTVASGSRERVCEGAAAWVATQVDIAPLQIHLTEALYEHLAAYLLTDVAAAASAGTATAATLTPRSELARGRARRLWDDHAATPTVVAAAEEAGSSSRGKGTPRLLQRFTSPFKWARGHRHSRSLDDNEPLAAQSLLAAQLDAASCTPAGAGEAKAEAEAAEAAEAADAFEQTRATPTKKRRWSGGKPVRRTISWDSGVQREAEAAAAEAAGAAGAAVAGVTQRRSMRWEYARFSEMKLLLTYQGAPVSFRCAMLPVGPPPYSPFQG
jgi:hypothetical protein